MNNVVVISAEVPDLAKWGRAVDPVALNRELGREFAGILKTYFETKNAQPNAKGWPKTGFWQSIADATEFDENSTDATGATVVIGGAAGRRFALRYLGGVVRPKTAKALAIPMNAAAAAAGSPREMSGLFLIRTANGDGALAREEGGALRVYFLLKKSTTHRPDPSSLPPMAEVEGRLRDHAETFIALKLEEN